MIQELSFEDIRLRYFPGKVRVLFIGESPPKGGTFFYLANSNLFKYTKEAFDNAYIKNYERKDFCNFFMSLGCFLDDLCHEPINHEERTVRLAKRKQSVPSLAERIKKYNPDAVVVVIKGIKSNVEDAVKIAGVEKIPMYFLPFPAQGNQRKYVKELASTLFDLKKSGILASGV